MVWPGYTPPASGSSMNCGTHPLTAYTDMETDFTEAYTADGWDVTQEPPQVYAAWTCQKRNEAEAHFVPENPA